MASVKGLDDKGCTTIHDLVTSDGNLIWIMPKLFDTNSEYAVDCQKIRALTADWEAQGESSNSWLTHYKFWCVRSVSDSIFSICECHLLMLCYK
jgi:hypothetical protein